MGGIEMDDGIRATTPKRGRSPRSLLRDTIVLLGGCYSVRNAMRGKLADSSIFIDTDRIMGKK